LQPFQQNKLKWLFKLVIQVTSPLAYWYSLPWMPLLQVLLPLNPLLNSSGDVEEAFAKAEIAVFSNAKNHRMDSSVPILIPYVNSDQIDIIPKQREERGYNKGYIVTNANCSTTGNFRLRFLRSD
jgi:hypothetical protein